MLIINRGQQKQWGISKPLSEEQPTAEHLRASEGMYHSSDHAKFIVLISASSDERPDRSESIRVRSRTQSQVSTRRVLSVRGR